VGSRYGGKIKKGVILEKKNREGAGEGEVPEGACSPPYNQTQEKLASDAKKAQGSRGEQKGNLTSRTERNTCSLDILSLVIPLGD